MTITLLQGDCLQIIPTLTDRIDFILTDPPYPDYYAEEYNYQDGMIDFLKDYPCRQFVFWSAKVDFPLDYSAIHIWDKAIGCASTYERIFERNGDSVYKIFRHMSIFGDVRAKIGRDTYTGHPSQKPIRLLQEIIQKFTQPGDTILDPFAGSGTTGIAAVRTGRNAILIEKDPGYFAIMSKRIADAQQQMRLPLDV
jgi:DNA modification methylase